MNRRKQSQIADMPSVSDIEGLFDHYLAHGCPCRFPRFRATVSRDLSEIGAREWGVSDVSDLLDVFDRRVGLLDTKQEDFALRGFCEKCGAEVIRSWAPIFRDSFLSAAHISPGRLPDLGAEIGPVLPVCGVIFQAGPGNATRDEKERIQRSFPRLKPADWIAYMGELAI